MEYCRIIRSLCNLTILLIFMCMLQGQVGKLLDSCESSNDCNETGYCAILYNDGGFSSCRSSKNCVCRYRSVCRSSSDCSVGLVCAKLFPYHPDSTCISCDSFGKLNPSPVQVDAASAKICGSKSKATPVPTVAPDHLNSCKSSGDCPLSRYCAKLFNDGSSSTCVGSAGCICLYNTSCDNS